MDSSATPSATSPGASASTRRPTLSQRFSITGLLPFSNGGKASEATLQALEAEDAAAPSHPAPLLGAKPRAILSAAIGDSRQLLDNKGKLYFAYVIAVVSDTDTWNVDKRYSEFSDFYEELRDDPSSDKIDLSGFLFPNKSLFHNSDQKTLERRKAGFQHMLDLVIEQNPSYPGLLRFLAPTLATPSRRWSINDMGESPADDLGSAVQNSGDSAAKEKDDGSSNGVPTAPPPLSKFPSSPSSTSSSTVNVPQQVDGTGRQRSTSACPRAPYVSGSAVIDDGQPTIDFALGLVRIKKVEATRLKNVELIGGNDAFITFAFDHWRGRTCTRPNAGDHASWATDGDDDFTFDASSKMLANTPLRVAAFDDNDLKSEVLIGKGAIFLNQLLAYGLGSEITLDVELKDKKYLYAGTVRITLDVIVHPETLEENMRKAHEGGLVFAGFYTVIIYVGYVLYKVVTFSYGQTLSMLIGSTRSFGTRLISYAQVVVFLGFFFIYFHRMLGYSVTKYLKYLMNTPSGAFNLNFDWISLRLGLDESEIVLKNFIWKNPDIFSKSPYFVKVQRMGIRFQPETVISAIRNITPIEVSEVEIDGVSVYIERRPKEGLNLWACLGAGDEVDSTADNSIESSVVQSVSSAMKLAQASDDDEIDPDVAPTPSSSNLFSKLGFNKEGSKSDDSSINRMDAKDSTAVDPQFDISLDTRASAVASTQKGTEVKTSAWGVPFTFIVNRLDIINITAYVQDYLNATHSSYNSLNAIKIARIEMRKGDLASKNKRGVWKGAFLDDLVWKVIGELVTTLLASNSGSLALIAASAAANNTASAAISTTLKASKGIVESIHNYNPSAVMSNAYKRASTMLSSPMNVEQESMLREMGVTAVQVRIIRVRKVTRKSAVPDSVYVSASLAGGPICDSSTYTTYTRSCEKDGTAVLEETALLTPLTSLGQTIVLKLFDKRITRIVGSDKLIASMSIPLAETSLVGRKTEVVSWATLRSDAMYSNTGEVEVGIKLV